MKKLTPEAMAQALQEVEAGRLSLRQAAGQFGVPKSSLSDRVSGKVASGCARGQRPLLTPEDENSLVQYCLYSASHRFPLTKPQVLAHALAIYNLSHPEAPKTELGQMWWINFREWHHHRLTARIPDIIDHERASCAKRGPMEEYFRLLTTTLEEHGLREKPRQIYNCDETGFQLDSARRQVIVPRGTTQNKQAGPGNQGPHHRPGLPQRGWGGCPPHEFLRILEGRFLWCYRRSVGGEPLLLGFQEGVFRDSYQRQKDWRVVVAGFRRCGLCRCGL